MTEKIAASILIVMQVGRFFPENDDNKLLWNASYINTIARNFVEKDNGNFIRMAVRTENLIHLSYWYW